MLPAASSPGHGIGARRIGAAWRIRIGRRAFMPTKKSPDKAYVKYHSDGTVWAKGQHRAGKATGYWEWFRKDGTRLSSGHFEGDEQVGEWTTYDRKGAVYKVTVMKPERAKMKL